MDDRKLVLLETLSHGGIETPVKEAQKMGDKLFKEIFKNNRKFNPKERKKDYSWALVESTLEEEKHIFVVLVTPEKGWIPLRWTNKETGITYLPNKVFAFTEYEDGSSDIVSLFGFANEETKQSILNEVNSMEGWTVDFK